MLDPREPLPAAELRRLRDWLQNRALHLTLDRELAKDLVQETFLALCNRRQPIDLPLEEWLSGVLRNQYRMWCRGEARRTRRDLASASASADPTVEHDRQDARTQGHLVREIESLDEPYRSTLQLRFVNGLHHHAIAGQLGLAPSSIRRRCTVGLRLLRQRLTGADGMRGFAFFPWWTTPAPLRRLARFAAWLTPAAALIAVLAVRTPHTRLPAHAGARGLHAETSTGQLASGRKPHPRAAARSANHLLISSTAAQLPPGDDELAAARAAGAPDGKPTAAPAATNAADSPCVSLQARIDRARPGDTVMVPACLYREAININKPLVLDGSLGAELRGSDLWTAFHAGQGMWVSANRLPDPAPSVKPYARHCTAGAQVFLDGVRMARVDGVPQPGTYAVNPDRRVVLGDDPAGHQIEVTSRQRWVTMGSNDVTVRGFRMRHALGTWAALFLPAHTRNGRLENNVLSDAQCYAIGVEGSDHTVVGNMVSRSGFAGITLSPTERIVIKDNLVFGNGLLISADATWEAGGIMGIIANAVFENNIITDNRGSGLFCLRCNDAVVRGNTIRDNGGNGLIVYRNSGGTVVENVVSFNGKTTEKTSAGILLAHSLLTDVQRNASSGHAVDLRVEPVTP